LLVESPESNCQNGKHSRRTNRTFLALKKLSFVTAFRSFAVTHDELLSGKLTGLRRNTVTRLQNDLDVLIQMDGFDPNLHFVGNDQPRRVCGYEGQVLPSKWPELSGYDRSSDQFSGGLDGWSERHSLFPRRYDFKRESA
jgi:hypothetical protein